MSYYQTRHSLFLSTLLTQHRNTHKLPLTVTNREKELRTSLTNDKKSEREDSVVSLNPAKSLVVGEYNKMLIFFVISFSSVPYIQIYYNTKVSFLFFFLFFLIPAF